MDKYLRELLRRKDPQGYYVVPLRREALAELDTSSFIVEETGDVILVRVKSRSMAIKLIKWALKRNLLCIDQSSC